MPTLGGDQLYLQQELAAISNAIAALNTAIKADEAAITADEAAISANAAAISAINNPTVLQFNPTVPAASSWTASQGYMQGWGSVAKLTPTRSGKVLVMGIAWRSPSVQPAYLYGNIYFGTGTAPAALSTAVVGTTTDTQFTVGSGSTQASVYDLVNFKTICTGLTLGTQYWFDARITSGANATVSCANDHIILAEL
jgi:hypothetical protein